MTDPISDFVTRIRNASAAGKQTCIIPSSKMKLAIAGILETEGYIAGVKQASDDRGHPTIEVGLKYVGGKPVITGIERVSTPGRRIYSSYGDIPRVLNGLGTAILSTSRGIMKDQDCRRQRVGGELICNVW